MPPNWKHFLNVADNKSNLARYYTDYLMENWEDLAENQHLFVSGGREEEGIILACNCQTCIPSKRNLIRLILLAITAAEESAEVIMVYCPGTGILVLLLHHWPSIKAEEIYFMTGRQGMYGKLMVHPHPYNLQQPSEAEEINRIQHRLLLPVYGLQASFFLPTTAWLPGSSHFVGRDYTTDAVPLHHCTGTHFADLRKITGQVNPIWC